jgi:FADH2 O2-dependent halogenase
MRHDYDLAIVGSGFGGSLLSMVACRLGLSVLLLERGTHPRFAIGESTAPLTNLLLEQLARRYDLPALLPLTSHGPWQRTYPEIVCGLKRGFTFYHHQAGRPFRAEADRRNQLLVAASPNDEVADTHWLRADVDHFLVQQAIAAGADYVDEAHLVAAEGLGSDAATLSGERRGQQFRFRARLVIDATGPRGFLSRCLGQPDVGFAGYPPTQTLFSHFADVPRCESMGIFDPGGTPPYPPDDAALHHVFDGGWMWVLRFHNGVTSAGIAVTDSLAEELALAEGAPAWERFLRRFPSIRDQFAGATPLRPFVYAPRLAYRTSAAAGEGWALLPSAAGFVDPLFSTGMPLTLLGIERLGRVLEETWGHTTLTACLHEYGDTTLAEVDGTAHYIAGAYAGMQTFPLFTALSMFYFVAASYSEIARRLEKPPLSRRFLAADHLHFGPNLQRCAALLRASAAPRSLDIGDFERRVTDSVACLNIAGLSDGSKRNWYGVDLEDLVRNASKLQMTPTEMRRIVETAPWAQSAPARVPA